MIDRRTNIENHDEIDLELRKLSETDIMLETSRTLASIYPHLVKIRAHCNDPFDDFVEPFFFNFAYLTFSSKTGIIIKSKETHKFGFHLHRYQNINHIIARPKQFPILIVQNGQERILTETDLKNKELAFIQFGDMDNYLSGDDDQVNIDTVNFDYSELVLTEKQTGLTFKDTGTIWIKNDLLNFIFVAETYNQKEHKHFKHIYAD
jgi:hypothetical protein